MLHIYYHIIYIFSFLDVLGSTLVLCVMPGDFIKIDIYFQYIHVTKL